MVARLLRLRDLRPSDEEVVGRAQQEMAAERFVFAIGYRPGQPWADYLREMQARRVGVDLPPRWVPSTFLLAEVDGEVVGRVSIRHQLNDFLAREGGHIGYGVLPEHRRRGYATEMLRQALGVVAGLGVDPALVTCDDDNVGSAVTIERCGGVFESHVVGESGVRVRRYWVPTTRA